MLSNSTRQIEPRNNHNRCQVLLWMPHVIDFRLFASGLIDCLPFYRSDPIARIFASILSILRVPVSRGLFTFCLVVVVTVANASDGWKPKRLIHDGLPNAYQLHAKVISGGTPDGKAGFASLKRIGVKTVISVDGARPDLKNAEELGLRYVHLPHGYDGISASHEKTLAKAVTTLPGRIYIHCHHGRHRSPAAAMVACIGAGLVESEKGVTFLRMAGTSERYVGLYAAVDQASPFEDDELDRLDVAFAKVTDVPPLAKAMVKIEVTFDNLMTASRSNWIANTSYPDIDAAHQALILKEDFAEILRTVPRDETSKEYREILRSSHEAASRMEAQLNRRPVTAEAVTILSAALTTLKTDCRRCHASYRQLSHEQVPAKSTTCRGSVP